MILDILFAISMPTSKKHFFDVLISIFQLYLFL